MVTNQQIQGNWNQIKGELQARWGELSDQDLSRVKGDINKLVGVIQERTGETRAAIESFFESAYENCSSNMEQASEQARAYAEQVNRAAHEQYEYAADTLSDGIESAKEVVQSRPAESVAVCFGAGLIAGAVLGLILNTRR